MFCGVYFQPSLLCKRLGAKLAPEGLLPCVNAHVPFKFGFADERFVAFGTLMWFDDAGLVDFGQQPTWEAKRRCRLGLSIAPMTRPQGCRMVLSSLLLKD